MVLFDWDESNLSHVARHSVTPGEAEQAVANNPLDLDSYIIDHEVRYEAVGMTSAGRILKTVAVVRGSTIRVLTAFDAPPALLRKYLQSMVN